MLEAPADGWRAEIRTAFDLARAVAGAVSEAIAGGVFPLVLSGNCAPAALGCVAGLPGAPSVFWFDAHGDFNTPDTTIGGFLDGMALAAVTGRCWPQLTAAIPGFEPVPEEWVALLGTRDLDPLEAEALGQSAVRWLPPGDVRGRLPEVLRNMRPAGRTTYLHLDLDVLDPSEGRVNPYAAPDGLSRGDVARAIRTIAGATPLGAAALTALDPDSDSAGRAVEAALELAVTMVDAASGQRVGSG
jgi:arginase